MTTNTRRNRGLSLIELMIVVAILGILAAMVIPKFSNANESAKGGAVASQLHTIKKSLNLYKLDHNDVYPTDAQLITNQWQVLVNSTDIDGDITGSDFGPYFTKPPMNAFTDSNTVASDNSGAWQYDAAAGTIKAVVPQSVYDAAASFQLDTSDLVVAP